MSGKRILFSIGVVALISLTLAYLYFLPLVFLGLTLLSDITPLMRAMDIFAVFLATAVIGAGWWAVFRHAGIQTFLPKHN